MEKMPERTSKYKPPAVVEPTEPQKVPSALMVIAFFPDGTAAAQVTQGKLDPIHVACIQQVAHDLMVSLIQSFHAQAAEAKAQQERDFLAKINLNGKGGN